MHAHAPLLWITLAAAAGCGGGAPPAEPAPPPPTGTSPPAADSATAVASDPPAGTPIDVPDPDDPALQPRQRPITAGAESPSLPLPENADIGYACEDGGLIRVVWTRTHANLSLDGVFRPLARWADGSTRSGAEAWAGDHLTLFRRGEVVELREADGRMRRCRASSGD